MIASQIVDLLARRHKEDVFVPECKNGPSQSGRHVRLDAWAMPRSWSHPAITGYEIKVSRGDFLNDNKWHSYLPLCNLLWFVCPNGLISEREVPEGVGLMYVAATGRTLRTVRKASHREVQIPESLWRYILMCRAKIKPPGFFETSRADRFRAWLAEKAEDRKLGYDVSRAVREQVEKVERENRQLRDRMTGYDDVRKALERLGIKDNGGVSSWTVERRAQELSRIVPKTLTSDLEQVEKLGIIAARIRKDLESLTTSTEVAR